MAVSTVSYTKTPQAGDDFYETNEDFLVGGSILVMDVMSNDLGGKAKTLYSIDNGDALADLLTKDPGLSTAWESTTDGNQIRINNGKIEFRLCNTSGVNALAEGEVRTDTFKYAIQLGNGTISYATVAVNIVGKNDAASITGDTGGNVVEDGGVANAEAGDPDASGQLSVSDVDNGEAKFKAPASLDGDYGSFTFDADTGKWTYTLDQAKADKLTGGEKASDSLVVKSLDGTASETIKVNITGANDKASISVVSVDDAVVEAGGQANAEVGDPDASGQLSVSDVDNGEAKFKAPASLDGDYGSFTFDADTGKWTYTLDQAKADKLTGGEKASDSLVVKSLDGTASETIKVNITGANDKASISVVSVDDDTLVEDGGVANALSGDPDASGQLSVSDVDNGEAKFKAPASLDGDYGSFTFDADTGKWTYTLDQAKADKLNDGEQTTDSLVVDSFDGTASETITVSIAGANDKAVISGATTADLTESNAAQSTGGQLYAADVDNPSDVFKAQTDVAGSNGHGKFSIDAAGAWTYTMDSAHDEFVKDQEYTDSITVKSADSTEQVITVTMTGTNDAPELAGAQATLVGGTEDTDYVVSAADLLSGFSDVDGDTLSVDGLSASDGSVADNGDGTFTIKPSANFHGPVTLSYDVIDGNGGSVAATLGYSLAAVNDAASLGSADVHVNETNAPITTSGTLSISDIDSAQTFQAQNNAQGSYGKFSIGSAGAWSYAADSAYDSLNVGQSVSDIFDVFSADGTKTTVKVTIDGTADGAVVAPPVYGAADPNDNDAATGTASNASNGDSVIVGTNGNDNLTGVDTKDGADTIYGRDGNDTIYGVDKGDTLYGNAGADTLSGDAQNDVLYGGSGDDILYGGDQSDTLYGGSGNDQLFGGAQDDILIGGYGADTLTGNAGADTFKFLSHLDTGDTIAGFSAGDQIDLAALYAGTLGFTANTNSLSANSVITFYDSNANQTIVQADLDGNVATAEFQIQLTGNIGLAATDFVL